MRIFALNRNQTWEFSVLVKNTYLIFKVCGLALDYLTKENDGDVALLLQLVEEQLLNHSRTTKDKFVECVYYMKTYFPVIIDK